ncbi:MAG: aromatic ring-hydroxylating oxygenase subunit alpha [Planctomycetota bacterium]|jgi:choline monooxygenase
MSELGKYSHSKYSDPQLPAHWYFDDGVAALEQRRLFESGPGYVGHELMVPHVGDYHTLSWQDDSHVLVRNESGVLLLSNVCRHRQATVLHGCGKAKNLVCPLHRWTYGLDGRLLGAPHFQEQPSLDLACIPVENWNGLLFRGPRSPKLDLQELGCFGELSVEGYVFQRVETTEYHFNWKTFIEVFLEDYHVEPFHPGLSDFVDCRNIRWEMGCWYNVQTVPIKRGLRRAGSSTYRIWQDQVLEYSKGILPKQGAIWLVYYPNVMIEWYPNTLIVSTVIPRGAGACSNVVEFYFPEDIVQNHPQYMDAQYRAYSETALEDQVLCDRMTQGRRALVRQGLSQVGPYQSPTEDGLKHFHMFLHRELDPYVN